MYKKPFIEFFNITGLPSLSHKKFFLHVSIVPEYMVCVDGVPNKLRWVPQYNILSIDIKLFKFHIIIDIRLNKTGKMKGYNINRVEKK